MCSFCARTIANLIVLIRQVAALRYVKNSNIDYTLMFANYLWLCSRWNFCNRSTLRENIPQSMMFYFLRHGVELLFNPLSWTAFVSLE